MIDKLVELVIESPDRESLISRTRALDRVLLWKHYVIPHFHLQASRLVFWNIFGRPKNVAKYSRVVFLIPGGWTSRKKKKYVPGRINALINKRYRYARIYHKEAALSSSDAFCHNPGKFFVIQFAPGVQ